MKLQNMIFFFNIFQNFLTLVLRIFLFHLHTNNGCFYTENDMNALKKIRKFHSNCLILVFVKTTSQAPNLLNQVGTQIELPPKLFFKFELAPSRLPHVFFQLILYLRQRQQLKNAKLNRHRKIEIFSFPEQKLYQLHHVATFYFLVSHAVPLSFSYEPHAVEFEQVAVKVPRKVFITRNRQFHGHVFKAVGGVRVCFIFNAARENVMYQSRFDHAGGV